MTPRMTVILNNLKAWLVNPVNEAFSAPVLFAERSPNEESITGYPAVLIHVISRDSDGTGSKCAATVLLRLYVQEMDDRELHAVTEQLELDIIRGIKVMSKTFGGTDWIYESTQYRDGVIGDADYEAKVRLAEIKYRILYNEVRI